MITLYKWLTCVAYATAYPYTRSKAAAGSALWSDRLGLGQNVGPKDIWLHAASAGESRVISYLVDYLRRNRAALNLHLTVMTETGFRAARKTLPPDISVSFCPLDAARSVNRALDAVQPRLLVIAETEIWPNLVQSAAARNIPIILVNGRMSERAFRRYRVFRRTMTNLLALYDRLFLKSELDRERYLSCGADEQKTVVAGDMKFDAPLMARSEGRIKEIRNRVGVGDNQFLLVAGSTRPGEEALLLQAYRSLKDRYPQVRFLLAPRHVERSDEIVSLLNEKNQTYYIYGDKGDDQAVILVNRMGLLADLYMAADVAFVGGTLVDIGGHNLLEPVWAGTPVLFGPYLANVRQAAEYISEHMYGTAVNSVDDLETMLTAILEGNQTFRKKTETDLTQSATAVAGDFILGKLSRA